LGDDNVMLCEYEPADGYFGFHSFEKRNYGNKLLPDEYHPYYVVGNLNTKKYPKFGLLRLTQDLGNTKTTQTLGCYF